MDSVDATITKESLLVRIEELQAVGYNGGFKVSPGNVRVPYEVLLPTEAEVLALRFSHPNGELHEAIAAGLATVNCSHLMQILSYRLPTGRDLSA